MKQTLLSEPDAGAFSQDDAVLRVLIGSAKKQGRTRNPVSRSNLRTTFKIPSIKCGRMVQCESEIEANQAIVLEADPSVVRYQEQPLKLIYTQWGVRRQHIPDFLVERDGSRELIENKCDDDGLDPAILARTAFLQDRLVLRGYQYRLVTEGELHQGVALANAKFLMRNAVFHCSQAEEFAVLHQLKHHGAISLQQAREFDPTTRFVGVLCRLMLSQTVHFDTQRLIDQGTIVRFTSV